MENSLAHDLVNEEEICLVDSATTHTILKSKVYFSYLVVHDAVVNTPSVRKRMSQLCLDTDVSRHILVSRFAHYRKRLCQLIWDRESNMYKVDPTFLI